MQTRTHTRSRATVAALSGIALVGSFVTALAPLSPAQAAPPERTVTLTPLGTYASGSFDEGASEIVAHDPVRQRVFVVNAQAGTVDVLSIADPSQPTKVGSLSTPGANSVAVHGDIVAVAEQAVDKVSKGHVGLFNAESLALVRSVEVGSLPDMVTITADGSFAVVANEGEPEGYCAGQVDPEGSVSVIDLRKGAEVATAREASFAAYDSAAEALRADGVRFFGPGASVSQDVEPEYVATSTNSQTAWVTLQENNAIATVDLRSATVTGIAALGTKDHSAPGSGFDASDKDKAVNIAPHPVRGLYLPDSVVAYQVRDAHYLVTANEGDARDYDCFTEEVRVKDVALDPVAFPNAAALQASSDLGRLKMTTTSPQGPNGYTEINSFGGRSVSVRDAATGELMWDSGDAFEMLTAEVDAVHFNANHAENGADDRSDDKGPEPEGVDVGKIDGRTYAFVGLERNSGIVAVDVTDPRAGRVVGFGTNRADGGDPEARTAGDLGPEGLHFIPAEDSPTGVPLLVVGNEVSGTTTVWEVTVR